MMNTKIQTNTSNRPSEEDIKKLFDDKKEEDFLGVFSAYEKISAERPDIVLKMQNLIHILVKTHTEICFNQLDDSVIGQIKKNNSGIFYTPKIKYAFLDNSLFCLFLLPGSVAIVVGFKV